MDMESIKINEMKTISGRFNDKGDLIVNQAAMKYVSDHFKGKNIIITFSPIEEKATAKQLAYYYKVVIPSILDGFLFQGVRYTQKQIDDLLCNMSPFLESGNLLDGIIVSRPNKASVSQLNKHIEMCIQFAAENLGVVIPEAQVLIK